jgi:hypothetical protein
MPSHAVPQNFRPSDIYRESTVETSITQWRNGFRQLWPGDEDEDEKGVYMNIIHLEEERPWLETLKNSNHEFHVPLGDIDMECWQVVQPEAAIQLIANKLHRSMAYDVVLVDKQIANSWANSLVESFTSDEGTGAVTWYTNWDPEEGNSWNPVTENTFDFCAVGVDTASKSIGYLLMTDED